jgi:hypothetical protein
MFTYGKTATNAIAVMSYLAAKAPRRVGSAVIGNGLGRQESQVFGRNPAIGFSDEDQDVQTATAPPEKIRQKNLRHPATAACKTIHLTIVMRTNPNCPSRAAETTDIPSCGIDHVSAPATCDTRPRPQADTEEK